MTLHRVKNTRVHFWTFSPVSVNFIVKKAEKVIENPDPLKNEIVDYPRWILSLYEVNYIMLRDKLPRWWTKIMLTLAGDL